MTINNNNKRQVNTRRPEDRPTGSRQIIWSGCAFMYIASQNRNHITVLPTDLSDIRDGAIRTRRTFLHHWSVANRSMACKWWRWRRWWRPGPNMFASSPIFLSYAVLVKVHDHIVALVDLKSRVNILRNFKRWLRVARALSHNGLGDRESEERGKKRLSGFEY